jgi:hypothetical protein
MSSNPPSSSGESANRRSLANSGRDRNARTAAGSVTRRQLFERALAICVKTLGPDHPDTATSLDHLATLLQG